MPLITIKANPGMNSQQTQVQAAGQWFVGNLVRWRTGMLEKIGGWRRLIATVFAAHIRDMHAWLDLDNNKNLLVGTDAGLQLVVNDTAYSLGAEIAVVGPTQTLPSSGVKFGVASGSTSVHVVLPTPITVRVGSSFLLRLPISIGGRILLDNTFFVVTSIISPTEFTFDMPLTATVTEGPVPGLRSFAVTAGTINNMVCTFKAHGLSVGNTFRIPQLTYHNALPQHSLIFPAGQVFTVATVTDVNTFTFNIGGLGSGLGGGTVSMYDGEYKDTPASIDRAATVISVPSQDDFIMPQKQTWFVDNLGEDGLALATGGALRVYKPPVASGAFISTVEPAPAHSNGMFVAMPQAQVILWGTEAILDSGIIDPLLVRWSHAGTYDVWTASATNQAGSQRLGRGSQIIGGIQAPQTTLLLTDTDIWSMSYIGPPLVYGFTVMGTGCGLLAPHAVATLGRTTYWISENGLWQYGDTGVQPLVCPVYDYIFRNMDNVNVNKCFAAANSSANEISFFFPGDNEALPLSEKDNMFRWSQDYSKNVWEKTGATVVETAIILPPGPPIAVWVQSLLETSDNSVHQMSQLVYKRREIGNYTFTIYAHTASTRNMTLRAWNNGGSAWATFNPLSRTMIASDDAGNFTLMDALVTTDDIGTGVSPPGNGWSRYVLKFQSDNQESVNLTVQMTNGLTVSYAGAGLSLYTWGAMLNTTLSIPPYQRTNMIVQNEPGYYVKYNPVERCWDSGQMRRTAWIDNNVFGPPLGADINDRVQQHEIGYDDDDKPMRGVYVESGFTAMGDGAQMAMIDQCHPDFKWFGLNGAVTITLKGLSYPGDEPQVYGPYSMTPSTQFFSTRLRGRYVAFRYDWIERMGFSARVGGTVVRVKTAGRRP